MQKMVSNWLIYHHWISATRQLSGGGEGRWFQSFQMEELGVDWINNHNLIAAVIIELWLCGRPYLEKIDHHSLYIILMTDIETNNFWIKYLNVCMF